MVCPKCGAPNDDNTWKCVQCQTILHTAPPPVAASPPEVIPNYLWQAIVCTVCCCAPLGIPAIVYAAQVNSKVDQGDIEGARNASKNAKMWCWIAFGLGLAFTLIYLTIAIPKLYRSMIAANEAQAVESLWTLNSAAIKYSATYAKGFPLVLSELGPPAGNEAPDAEAVGLIDKVLASGMKNDYVFTYSHGEKDANGMVKAYAIYADPIMGTTGQNHYSTDQTGIIRHERGMPANAQCPPIDK